MANSLRLAVVIFTLIHSRCFAQTVEPNSLEGYELSFPAMGSTISLNAYSDSQVKVEQAFSKVRAEIDRLVLILSDYEPDSELNQIHRQIHRQPSTSDPISNELYAVLTACERWHRQSDGAFDAALGNLTRRWREARKKDEIPSSNEIQQAFQHSGWNKVDLNHNDRRIRLIDSDVRIDLGGIAAGYIVDRAFEILVAHGLHRALVNDGGDIRCGDAPPGREGWRIEVAALAKRRDANIPLRRILLANAAITTSGDLWQYQVIDGKRHSHILDPKTGYGILGPTMVTVIAPTCIDADAAATAVSVLGPERGFEMIARLSNYHALFADRSRDDQPARVIVTPGFPNGIDETVKP